MTDDKNVAVGCVDQRQRPGRTRRNDVSVAAGQVGQVGMLGKALWLDDVLPIMSARTVLTCDQRKLPKVYSAI